MKKILMVLALFLVTHEASAQKTGNGGDGLRLNGKLYLLDLVEAGVEKNPYFSNLATLNPETLKRLQVALPEKNINLNLVALKLAEIANLDKVFAESILQTIEMYSWNWVNAALVDIKDEDSSLNYPEADLVQIAIRRGQSIKISQDAWAILDEAQRVALIFHESIYALVEPKNEKQSSPRAREVVGYLFMEELSKRHVQGLHHILQEDLPSLKHLASILNAEASSLNYAYLDSDKSIWFAPAIRAEFASGIYIGKLGLATTKDLTRFNDLADDFCKDEYKSELKYQNGKPGLIEVHLMASILNISMAPLDKRAEISYAKWDSRLYKGQAKSIPVGAPKQSQCAEMLVPKMKEAKTYADRLFEIK